MRPKRECEKLLQKGLGETALRMNTVVVLFELCQTPLEEEPCLAGIESGSSYYSITDYIHSTISYCSPFVL